MGWDVVSFVGVGWCGPVVCGNVICGGVGWSEVE